MSREYLEIRENTQGASVCPFCGVRQNHNGPGLWIIETRTERGLCYECAALKCPDLLGRVTNMNDELFKRS